MRALRNAFSAIGSAIGNGYDAVVGTERRNQPKSRTTSEDAALDARRRSILNATTVDLVRNFIVAKWIVRKHLDYVSTFDFQAKTPDHGYNRYLEEWWEQRTTAEAFDVAARHDHPRAVRISEAQRVLAGDVMWMKLAFEKGHPDRGKINAIHGDRIRMLAGDIPRNSKPEEWVNGVRVDGETGRALEYGLYNRTGRTGYRFNRTVPASSIIPYACYEFSFESVRGVSPLAAGLNWMKDTFEAFDHSNAKLKLAQLFGVAVYSDAKDGSNFTREGEGRGYEINPKGRGPFVLEMENNDRAEVIESRTQSTETNSYLQTLLLISLKALDIPFSFWDESFTNFYGSRGGLIQYQKSSKDRIKDCRQFQYRHCDWRLNIGVADGDLELPSGKELNYVTDNGYDFAPTGVPWWDKAKEVRGAAMAIAAGLSSPQRECREGGTVFEQNVLEIAQANEFCRDNGVTLTYADAAAFAPELVMGGQNIAA